MEALVVVAADDVSVMPPTTERERESGMALFWRKKVTGIDTVHFH